MILCEKLGLRFSAGRILWDFAAILVGMLAGGRLNIGTFLLALGLGPMVGVVDRWIKKHFFQTKTVQTGV